MTTPAAPAANSTNASTLSEWAGPYVTNMLGKTEAYTNSPYQVYGGPMTAGESGLQSKVFQGLGSLNFPSNLGQSFSSSGAYQLPRASMGTPPMGVQPVGLTMNQGSNGLGDFGPMQDNQDMFGGGIPTSSQYPQFDQAEDLRKQAMDNFGRGDMNQVFGGYNGKPGEMPPPAGLAGLIGNMPQQPQQQPENIAQKYMNPYLESVLSPQLAELRRQAQINNQTNMGTLTKSGAFGGGRQAIMQAEGNRNLLQEQDKAIGQGYANAYDKAQQQFNIEQGQAKTLADMMAGAGATQRGIEQEGITADYNEFLNQRDYPQKMLQFQQSMLQGLPISTVTNQAAPLSGIAQLSSTVGGLGNIMESLKKFNLTP